ncbi:hypothetical protein ACFL1R_00440 [Candidatus Latescibacterota bacterium]
MKIIAAVFTFLLISLSSVSWSETGIEGRSVIQLEGKKTKVVIDLGGGSIVDFHFLDQGFNPLTWNYPEIGDLKPRSMGHFICFDRLGRSSKTEARNGMTNHGESSKVLWKLLSQPVLKEGIISAGMSCELPIAGMQLKRTINLYENAPVFTVREEITNINKLGRVYNIVQHPSIAPPFLDETVMVDSNAKKGFWAGNPMPNIEEPVVYWPQIVYRGKLVDLRFLEDNQNPGVVSFVFSDDDTSGWVTACNPGKELLIGYIWELSDYPWLRIWRHAVKDKPFARGLEFGTTAMPRPFADILAKGSIFDHPVFEYIDTGETIVKAYTAFLAKIPVDYRGVADIISTEDSITLQEHGADRSRDIVIKIK